MESPDVIANDVVKDTLKNSSFDLKKLISDLKHYLPAQAPLKDFIHHNTLHSFQNHKFYTGLQHASEIFGYKLFLSIEEYKELYSSKKISNEILEKVISQRKGSSNLKLWKEKLIYGNINYRATPRIGCLRKEWKNQYKLDLDALVHPTLFKVICSYLDQGIAAWKFPVDNKGFIASVKVLEKTSFVSLFRTKRARQLLQAEDQSIEYLLNILTGDEVLYYQYIFDQQFNHPGWSGMASIVEDNPESLLDQKKITLEEMIRFELLLEIDALDYAFPSGWKPLSKTLKSYPEPLFKIAPESEYYEILNIWQDAFEWTYYDNVLSAIHLNKTKKGKTSENTFQAVFCIDDREVSFRDYIEKTDPDCATFSTPGFFNVEFYFQPQNGKSYLKQCPAQITPKILIKESGRNHKRKKDKHFEKPHNSLFKDWLVSHIPGFWAALKLFFNIFYPTQSHAASWSFSHMDPGSVLTIENESSEKKEHNLKIGFTADEMTDRVEGLLRSIGLINNFAPLIYIVGHGASSVNNPHYSAYDCGACCGKPGSVNARVFAFMANHSKVRENLKLRNIYIPSTTQFIGALHDTTLDDILFYDDESLSDQNQGNHNGNKDTFNKALDLNAKERSRRFESIDSKSDPAVIHDKIRTRAVSLFEPRPELNHATNALCIVGRRELTENLFLDRRAFLNSYDYRFDPEGQHLFDILKAAAPVCGGINLEYYFSRVDNNKLGAGSKLPHNIMGLFGVANGIEGDLRSGLPSQMVEVHDPIRLMLIVEQFPEVILKVIQKSSATYEWFANEWIHLASVNPETKEIRIYKNDVFLTYNISNTDILFTSDIIKIIENSGSKENIPAQTII